MAGREDPEENSRAAVIGSTQAEHVDKEEPVKNSGAAGLGGTPAEENFVLAAADPDVPGDGIEAEEELVEMPEDYLRWLLAQTRETDPVPTMSDYNTRDPEKLKRLQEQVDVLQAMEDEFFEFQASVREKVEKDGRVLVPAAAVGPTDQFQEEIDEIWYCLLKEYEDADSKADVSEPEIISIGRVNK